MRVPLLSASYSAESLIASAQRCINLYPEANPPDASAPTTFYGTPGLSLWTTISGAGGLRLLFRSSNNILFAVRGNTLSRYSAGSWVDVTTLSTSTGRVVAADNGNTAVFVDGTTTAPTIDLSTFAVGAMSGDGWYGADFVYYIDGFFVFNKPRTQTFYKTAALAVTLDPLDFASAESIPDQLVSMMVDHGEIWLFGEFTTEVFDNSGASDFPFQRIGSAIMSVGCAAKHSPAAIDNSIVWLGRDQNGEGMVWRAQGYNPVRISSHALEVAIRGYSRIDDAEAYVYQQNGHAFYVLNFPTADKTWVWDAATGLWHERAYRDSSNNLHRHRSCCHVLFDRMNLVGDWENGNIYEFDLGTYTDNGDAIQRIKSFQHLQADGKRIRIDRFELDIEVAVGSEAGEDPMASIKLYADRGKTLAATNVRSLGRIGAYATRVEVHRCGTHLDPVFEVSTTADAKIAFQGAFIDAVPMLR
jgi:hypothetical protein